MLHTISLICIILNFGIGSIHSTNSSVISWSLGSLRPFNSSLEFALQFFSPTKPGNYPVIIFLTGLDGLALGKFYNDFSSQIVEQSQSIIIEFDGLGIIHKQGKEEKIFEKTLNWTIENIEGLFMTDKTPVSIKKIVFPDVKTWGITLMGHSSGSHPPVAYLNGTCGIIKSLVLLDPVDGYTVTDHKPSDFITHPPNQLPFVTPTLILATGFDSVSLYPHIGAPCAPANMSNMRFYDSLSGPTWYFNFTSYGHMDMFDDFYREIAAKIWCKSCQTNCEFQSYRINIARAISLFIFAIREKNQKYLNAIESPNSSGMFDPSIKIESFFKHNNYDVLKTGVFCDHK